MALKRSHDEIDAAKGVSLLSPFARNTGAGGDAGTKPVMALQTNGASLKNPFVEKAEVSSNAPPGTMKSASPATPRTSNARNGATHTNTTPNDSASKLQDMGISPPPVRLPSSIVILLCLELQNKREELQKKIEVGNFYLSAKNIILRDMCKILEVLQPEAPAAHLVRNLCGLLLQILEQTFRVSQEDALLLWQEVTEIANVLGAVTSHLAVDPTATMTGPEAASGAEAARMSTPGAKKYYVDYSVDNATCFARAHDAPGEEKKDEFDMFRPVHKKQKVNHLDCSPNSATTFASAMAQASKGEEKEEREI